MGYVHREESRRSVQKYRNAYLRSVWSVSKYQHTSKVVERPLRGLQVIDDALPITGDEDLAVGRSADPDEIWIALLAKAYAKLHGSFASFAHAQD